jgi:hypothetical protein
MKAEGGRMKADGIAAHLEVHLATLLLNNLHRVAERRDRRVAPA